jgi:hypothetical protein
MTMRTNSSKALDLAGCYAKKLRLLRTYILYDTAQEIVPDIQRVWSIGRIGALIAMESNNVTGLGVKIDPRGR